MRGFHWSPVDSLTITRGFGVSFDVRPEQIVEKQQSCWWFEMAWRSCDAAVARVQIRRLILLSAVSAIISTLHFTCMVHVATSQVAPISRLWDGTGSLIISSWKAKTLSLTSCVARASITMILTYSYLRIFRFQQKKGKHTLITRFMGPTWGPPGADRTQVGPMLAHGPCYLGYCLPIFFQIDDTLRTNASLILTYVLWRGILMVEIIICTGPCYHMN